MLPVTSVFNAPDKETRGRQELQSYFLLPASYFLLQPKLHPFSQKPGVKCLVCNGSQFKIIDP